MCFVLHKAYSTLASSFCFISQFQLLLGLRNVLLEVKKEINLVKLNSYTSAVATICDIVFVIRWLVVFL